MTEIIDTNLATAQIFKRLPSTQFQNVTAKKCSQGHNMDTPKTLSQKSFTVTRRQTQSGYDLMFRIDYNGSVTTIKVHLLKKNGEILKIQEQQSKIYLIRKFLDLETFYSPTIDPSSGEVYFRLDYFQLKNHKSNFSTREINSIYKTINLQKLYQSVQKLLKFYEEGQQHNWTETNFQFEKHYQQLSKAICAVNESGISESFSTVSQSQYSTKTSEQESLNRKDLLQGISKFVKSEKNDNREPNKMFLANQMKEIQYQANNLGTLTKRKQGKSNYDVLLVNHSTEKIVRQAILKIAETKASRTSIKVVDGDLGKISVNLEKEDDPVYRTKMRFLNNLPKNTEYHFLDKYFKNPQTVPVLIYLTLKEESLYRYLATNAICISMQTKMRILLQICSGVHTLWEERNMILYVNSLNKIHITKNLTIKIRNITNFYKVEPHMLLEDKKLVNIRLMDNWLNLADIYFKIFFNHDLGYIRPASNNQGSRSIERCKATNMSRRAVGQKLLPEGLNMPNKNILTGLSYIFLSFVQRASQLSEGSSRKQIQRQVFMTSEEVQEKAVLVESPQRVLSYKTMCCWLFKNFQNVTQEVA